MSKTWHHWTTPKNECNCGCKIRLIINGRVECKQKLAEELKKQGYKLEIQTELNKEFDKE